MNQVICGAGKIDVGAGQPWEPPAQGQVPEILIRIITPIDVIRKKRRTYMAANLGYFFTGPDGSLPE